MIFETFNIYCCDRALRKGGGVATLVTNEINSELLFEYDDGYNQLLIVNFGKENRLLVNWYRPPNCPVANVTRTFNMLTSTLEEVGAEREDIIIYGDLNLLAIEWDNGSCNFNPSG